jgi:error-prone DNA polymerase
LDCKFALAIWALLPAGRASLRLVLDVKLNPHPPQKQLSPDRDLARLGVLGFGQGQGQDAVFEICADLLLVDLVRQRERARVVADVILGIDRLLILVLREVDSSVDLQDVVLKRDIEVLLLDPGHFQNDGERVVGLVDIGGGDVVAPRDRLFLLRHQFLLLAHAQFLLLDHGRSFLGVRLRGHVMLARTLEIVDRCRFSLDELAYQYPEERADPSLSPQETLEKLTWEGAAWRYPEGLPDDVVRTLRHELDLIERLRYAPYFLTVHSIVRFARSKDILCQGRGSAANSAVCYVLGITSIDPARNDLLFERFVSEERHEPPDIDVDFEHERREIVMQWIFDRYGRDHAALCSTVIRYRTKGAIRDVGKALGLTEDLIKMLSSQVWGWSEDGVEDKHVEALNLNLSDRRLRLALDLARELMGAPHHLSQHPGGFVLTHDRLDDLVPIEPAAMIDRQVIEWDKDDIDALKFMKVDVLALGMLTCMKKAFDFLAEHKGVNLDLATIPAEDPRTYAMIRKADTLGTFQIESRAQMSMLPRIKPRTFYDLVVEVAIVRPGPIQGDMVHPYLRRREGLEPVVYPKPELEQVLGKTLGVPLFQEQAMRVAIVCAGFTPGEADQLRKSMATFKFTGGVSAFRDKLIAGMVANGYEQEFAAQTFRQLEGFGSYGFPESHAASFALIAYASSWVKCWHPDVFCAALLNSQPMGFYAPAQIVRDAQAHGVEIRPICINASRWDCTLEPTGDEGLFAVRLGMRMVKGLANAHAATIVVARAARPFSSVDDLWRRAGVPSASLVQLAEADAFRPALGLVRREALWAIKALRDEHLPLFAAAAAIEDEAVSEINEPKTALRLMTAGSEVVQDYGHVGLTLRRHPVDVHHPRGRDRDRQPGGLAASIREIPPRCVERQHDRRARPHPARGRGGPPRGPSAR